MDLKDFISQTLISIVDGVKESQAYAENHNAFVNPGGLMRNTSAVDANAIWDNRTNNYAQQVTFDVAVTAEDSSEGGAKVKVLAGFLGGDIGGEKGNRNTVANRVQFTVPVLLPSQDVGDPAARIAGLRTKK